MRKNKLYTLILLLGMFISLLETASAASAKTMQISFSVNLYQNRARSVLKNINQYRKDNGLDELIMTKDLENIAIQRASELFVLYDNTRPDMTDYDSILQEYDSLSGYGYVQELIAAGYAKADDLWAEWESSAADAVLDESYTHIGVGCIYVKGSENEYYWCAYFLEAPENYSGKEAGSAEKAGQSKTMKVEIASSMFSHADNTHRSFELRVNDLTLKNKSTAEPSVYLYDKYDVKIGKVEPSQGLSYSSSNTKIFTVDSSGTVKRVKAGEATLTVKFTNLDSAQCKVTISGSSSNSSSDLSSSEIAAAVPELTSKEYTEHTTLSVYVKGADGYVLYRSTAKSGTYSKVTEEETSEKWNCKIQHSDLERSYYYKVRAFIIKNGKRVYSEYSPAVRIVP